MTAFPSKWPAQQPDRIQLYSLATPNGQKAGVMLEESGLPYEAHTINIMAGEQFDPEYVVINPNSKIPSMIDPNGPDGEPLAIMESGAMLLYLAEKSGKLLPTNGRLRSQAIQWLFFQVGGIGPMFGQFGHFHTTAVGKTDDYAVQRYATEAKRLLAVLDKQLESRRFLVGDEFTIADVATFPWINALDHYKGKDRLDYQSYAHVQPWVERCMERPAVQRGLEVCPFGAE